MMQNIEVSLADPRDVDPLFKLLQHQFSEHQITVDSDRLLSALHHLIASRPLGFALIAREDQCAVGFGVVSFAWTLEHGGKSAWLDELYVVPGRRGEGIGSLLIEKVIEEVKAQGSMALDLEVDADHRRSERLYKRKGFRRLERTRWVMDLG
jgi:GNAT superfamily N-acetyltransferase